MTDITHVPQRSVIHQPQLPGREQFELWNDAISSTFVPLRAAVTAPEAFTGSLITQPVGQTLVSEVTGPSLQVRRIPRDIAAGDPGWIKLGLQLRGYSVVSQDDREAVLAPGDFAIYDTSRPYELSFDDSFRMLVLMFPAHLLRLDARTLSGLTASRMSGRKGLGALASNLLGTLGAQLAAGGAPATSDVSDAVLALLSAALTERVSQEMRPTTDRQVLRLQVEHYIAAHLSDPGLTVAGIASAHHISVRYLQKLFKTTGTTVSEWIRTRRLDQCRNALTNPAMSTQTVAAVGMHWGFTDASSFSRAFKANYGYTPTEFRYTFNPSAQDFNRADTPRDGTDAITKLQLAPHAEL